MTQTRGKHPEEVRRVLRTALIVFLVAAAMTYVLFDIRFSVIILAVGSPSLLSLMFYLRKLEKEEVQEEVDKSPVAI